MLDLEEVAGSSRRDLMAFDLAVDDLLLQITDCSACPCLV